MKEWLSAQEIADEALPDLPETKSGVIRLAARERWDESLAYARARAGRGGGMEYHIERLPALARLAYERRHGRVAAPAPEMAALAEIPAALTERARSERDARLAVLMAFEAFSKGQRLGAASLAQIFVARYNVGALPVDPWVRERIAKLSKRSLQRWRLAKEAGRADALAVDPAKGRAGSSLLATANAGAVKRHVFALIAHQPHLSAANIRKLVRAEFGDTLVDRDGVSQPVPPIRTVQHFLKSLKERETVALAKLSDPDRYRSTMAPRGVGTLRHVNRANALWQIDASPADAECVDGRHAVYACVDIATRRTLFYASRTPRASAVALLMRKAILAWGVPEKVKTDNGSDFVAKDTKRLFASLGVEAEVSPAYTPQAKGHVERAIRTLQHDLMPLLPGYVGHSVADRKQLEARRQFSDRLGATTAELFGVSLTGAQLQRHLDDWAETTYQHSPHAGLGGRTPFQVAAADAERKRVVDERALDVLLMPVAQGGVRTSQAAGIKIDGFHYVLAPALKGDRVFVRMDPADAGVAYAFDLSDGHFIDRAVCAELAGIDPKALLAAKKAVHAEVVDRRMDGAPAEIRRLTRGRSLVERAIEVDRRDVPDVIPFPKREIEHVTPAIEAALDVTREAEVVRLDERQAAEHARLNAEPEGHPFPNIERFVAETAARQAEIEARAHVVGGNVAALPQSPKERFRRAKRIEAAMAAGEQVENAAAVWVCGYQRTAEYLGHQDIFEEAGPEWLAF